MFVFWADRFMTGDLRIVGLAGFQRASAGRTVGAAKGRYTDPVHC